jgi:hypothetical protein
MNFATDVLFKNQYSLSLSGFWRPFGNHDYYEARQPDRSFIKAPSYSAYFKLQSDARRMFSLSLYYKYWGNSSSINMVDHTYGIIPYLRIQSRFQLGFDAYMNKFTNSIGYVESFNDTIFMGQRNIKTFSNTLMFIISFTNKAWLNLKVRHYWSNIAYNKFYALKSDGKLESYDAYPSNVDQDFQMLNLDCSFKWEFAPGSQISIVWKNLFAQKDHLQSTSYFNTVEDMLDSPHYNSLSIRFLYYFDFIYLKKNGNNKAPPNTEN